jgi:antitoxin HicB
MNKPLEYYIDLPYTIELTPDPKEGWFVAVRELPGCISQGDTPEEALEMIQDAMRAWIEVSLEDGDPIPEPRPLEDYSGKFVVRVPRSLHCDLVETASREGVSLNQYINVALARAVDQLTTSAPSEEPDWPGLKSSIQRVLVAAGLTQEAGELDERLFANWVEQILSQVESALLGGYVQDARSYLETLAHGLRNSAAKSPTIAAFYRMVLLLCQQTEFATRLQQGVINDLMVRSRVTEFAEGANRSLAQQMIQEERVAYSEATTSEVDLGASRRSLEW